MIHKIRNFILIIGAVVGISLMVPSGAYAASAIGEQCANSEADVCKRADAKPSDVVYQIVNVLLFVIGAISVVMIILGGIMYTTSNGDSGQITKAKNTIIYAVVGLVVAFVAFAVVEFVVKKFIK